MLDDISPGALWMIGGIVLLAAEILAPGFFLVFIGAAALATGVFALLFGLGLPAQLALFALYALLAVLVGRRFYGNTASESSSPLLNNRAAQLVGRVVTVVEVIDGDGGRVRVGDSEWSARGGPGAAGDKVRITGVEGNCLIVEPERALPPA
jgi:membrane protein implicated in regulation of membrane protease activity